VPYKIAPRALADPGQPRCTFEARVPEVQGLADAAIQQAINSAVSKAITAAA
jgi:hypothetical protein